MQPLDPMSSVPPLPDRDDLANGEMSSAVAVAEPPRAHPAEPIEAVRTALVVEARDGKVNVFMPPLESVDDYAALDRHDRGLRARGQGSGARGRLWAAV